MEKKKKMRSCNSHIPTDIIFEHILIKVPAKSLMRFKLVCKLWQSTILHDRRFHLSHRRLSPSILALLGAYHPISAGGSVYPTKSSWEDSNYYPNKSLHKAWKNYYSYIRRSCDSTCWENKVWKDYYTTEVVNGIVCFYSKMNIYVCNLSTGETMKLPSSPGNNNHLCCYYLGFDGINNVYKLLKVQPCIMAIDRKNRDTSKILTLGYNHQTNDQNQDCYCWRDTSIVNSVQFHRSYCFKSALYWIVEGCLVCYDLDQESCSLIQYPLEAFDAPRVHYDSLKAELTQVGGRLALTHSYVGAIEFNIWLLHHNYEQTAAWEKITIHIPINLRDPCAAPSFFVGRAGTETNKIVLTIGRSMLYKPLIGLHVPVYSYNIESETWESIDNDYMPVVVSSSKTQADYSRSHIYYFHRDNILPLKDILAPK